MKFPLSNWVNRGMLCSAVSSLLTLITYWYSIDNWSPRSHYTEYITYHHITHHIFNYIPSPFSPVWPFFSFLQIHYRPDQWQSDQYFNVCTLWNFPSRTLQTRKPIFLSNKSGPNPVSIKSISSSFEVAQTLLLAITHSVPAPQPPSLPTSHHFSKKNVILSIL